MVKHLLFVFIFVSSLKGFSQGNTPETIETDFWFGNDWLFVTETNYTFNDDCFWLVGTTVARNFGTNDFDNVSRTTNTYNGSNIITEIIIELWNETLLDWVNSNRITFNYDGDNLLESIRYNWISEAWLEDTRTTGNFDGDSLGESITETWDATNTVWINSERTTYLYNTDGNLDTSTEFVWESGAWLENEQSIKEYNANMNLDISTNSVWDINTSSWLNDRRTLVTYNTDNLVDEREQEEWVNNAWVKRSLRTSVYDLNNDLEEGTSYDWDETFMLYFPKTRALYTRNQEGLPTIVVSQSYESDWVNTSRDRRSYPPCSSTLSSETVLIDNEIVVYPNPTADFIYINLKQEMRSSLRVYDLSGKQVYETQFEKSGFKLNMSHFPEGMYILEIQTDSKIESKKIIVN